MDTEIDLPRSPFSDAPVKRNAEEIQKVFFPRAEKVDNTGDFDVYQDGESGHVFIQDMQAWYRKDKMHKDDGKGDVDIDFNLIIFVSKDASYLKKAQEKFIPDDHELCIYVEDNSTDNLSDRVTNFESADTNAAGDELVITVYAGRDTRKVLNKWLREHFKVFKALQKDLGYDLDLSRKELKELIENGRIEKSSRSFMRAITALVNRVKIFAAAVYDAVGQAILAVTKGVRDSIKISDRRWDPEAKIKVNGVEQTNKDFTPFLIPFGHETIEFLSGLGEEGVDKVLVKLESRLQQEKEKVSKSISKLHKVRGVKLVLRRDLKDFLKTCEDYITTLLDKLIATCREIVPYMASMGKKWLNIVNAFYCGLWNALIEAVLGIVDLIGYIFVGIGMGFEASAEFDEILPEVLETIDEGYQAIINADYYKIFTEGLAAIVAGIKSIDFSSFSGPSISMEKVAYYFGAFIGFVVEILVGIFSSGGLTSITSTLNKIGGFAKGLKAFIVGLVKGAIGEGIGLSLKNMMLLLQSIIDVIKQGASKVVQLIEMLFASLKAGHKLVGELIDAIARKLDDFIRGLPASELYDPNKVAKGWYNITDILDEDELVDLGKTVFCSLK